MSVFLLLFLNIKALLCVDVDTKQSLCYYLIKANYKIILINFLIFSI